jgi:hypothetical protein
MRPQAHVAASLAISGCTGGRPWEAPLCAVAGNLPDFDRNVAKRLGVKRRDHHRWVSHSFVGWAPPTALALKLGGRRPAVRRALACLWGHLLLDSYADGIAWLWPLKEEKIGLFRKPEGIRDDGWKTPAPLSTNLGRAEAAFWALAALGALRR